MTAAASLLLAAAVETLVVGTLADPVTLDPHRATDLAAAAIVANVCETLVRYTTDGERPQPELATAWATRDGRRWTLTLREGVRFHDGAPFDADAVVANLRHLSAARGLDVAAERVGAHVVSLRLPRPNSALLATLSQPFFGMQSPRELVRPAPHRPVGTGPFRLGTQKPGRVELEANDGHWRAVPRLRRVVFERLATEAALTEAVASGRVDVSFAISHEHVAPLEGSADAVVVPHPGLNLALLSLNNARAPFSDVRVRQAIAHAVDRPALVARILKGHGEPARNPMPPSLWAYGKTTRELVTDRVRARRLLREAGFAEGLAVTLLVGDTPRPYNPHPRLLADSLSDDLASVGVQATVVDAPWSAFLDRVTRGDYEMAVLGWQADTSDPNDFLSALLASESIGTTNRSRYRSDDMDMYLKRGRQASDHRERSAPYEAAQALFQRHMPWVPLFHASVFTVRRRAVRGLAFGPTGIARYDKAWKES